MLKKDFGNVEYRMHLGVEGLRFEVGINVFLEGQLAVVHDILNHKVRNSTGLLISPDE